MKPRSPARPAASVTGLSAALLAVLVTCAVALVAAVPAQAAQGSAHRYWGYYQLEGGAWAFSDTGPDEAAPADGSVEGWRYAVATMDAPRYPRATPTFEDICGQTAEQEGSKRVGVLIDYGRPADVVDGTPPPVRADCAVVPSAATGSDVLRAVAEPRFEDGLMCGLDGHPAAGCFEDVGVPSAEAAAADEPVTPLFGQEGREALDGEAAEHGESGIGAATWVSVAALIIVAAAVAALLTLRRRRQG